MQDYKFILLRRLSRGQIGALHIGSGKSRSYFNYPKITTKAANQVIFNLDVVKKLYSHQLRLRLYKHPVDLGNSTP
jgi:hypothetical protein